jgi:hypothetical protein
VPRLNPVALPWHAALGFPASRYGRFWSSATARYFGPHGIGTNHAAAGSGSSKVGGAQLAIARATGRVMPMTEARHRHSPTVERLASTVSADFDHTGGRLPSESVAGFAWS